MPISDKELAVLLRLKRHEGPPPGFHDKFLQDFHRRQRSELLRLPLWRIALDRVGAVFGEAFVPRAAYAGSFALFLLAAVTVGFLGNTGDGTNQPILASQSATPITSDFWEAGPGLPAAAVLAEVVSETPRYVLDVRPVSYEATFSF